MSERRGSLGVSGSCSHSLYFSRSEKARNASVLTKLYLAAFWTLLKEIDEWRQWLPSLSVNDGHMFGYCGSTIHLCLLFTCTFPQAPVFGHHQRQSRRLVYAAQLLFCSSLKTELKNKFCINFSLICCLWEQMHSIHHIFSYVSIFFSEERNLTHSPILCRYSADSTMKTAMLEPPLREQ